MAQAYAVDDPGNGPADANAQNTDPSTAAVHTVNTACAAVCHGMSRKSAWEGASSHNVQIMGLKDGTNYSTHVTGHTAQPLLSERVSGASC